MSTPLLVLEKAIRDQDMRKMLVAMFNDRDKENANALQKAIDDLPGVETLKYKPRVGNKEIGTEIVELFSKMKLIPTFFFVDPWDTKVYLLD